MKRLIRRLSRVAHASSSHYCILRSDSTARHRSASSLKKQQRRSVPEGHVPIYVGEEMELFVVSAQLLNHPVFIALLNKSAQEYGYNQKGVLRIPCHVLVFERVLEALRLGGAESPDLRDLLGSFSDDSFLSY
ncbi:SMALL AUXIN UPREGULATED 72 [Hibiscus trionum]|uniref:SMALL AUXIN UPREGULATED 72 n=1 Tax=Hibiscus trionum TaxID=183268 RepID=A0A9W7M6Q8_HIBTR|nr:SMALL AUXIN UPREGULATED 72 [Hibiscus trionum]